jgi:hypothetical protein
MPKSGSTFLSDLISAMPDISRVSLVPSFGRREQELDESSILRAGRGPYVAQHHVRWSAWTEATCSKYDLKPIVLVRSLPDAVVSLRDHLRRESPIWPIFYAEDHHAELDDATLEDMIVRLVAPWFVNFYMSWRTAPDALMISYEELIADPAGALRRVLAFAGAEIDEKEIAKAIASVGVRRKSRFNVGVASAASSRCSTSTPRRRPIPMSEGFAPRSRRRSKAPRSRRSARWRSASPNRRRRPPRRPPRASLPGCAKP